MRVFHTFGGDVLQQLGQQQTCPRPIRPTGDQQHVQQRVKLLVIPVVLFGDTGGAGAPQLAQPFVLCVGGQRALQDADIDPGNTGLGRIRVFGERGMRARPAAASGGTRARPAPASGRGNRRLDDDAA